MTAMQKFLMTAAIAASAGTAIYEARRASHWEAQVRRLQQEQAPLADRVQAANRERDAATQKLAVLRQEHEVLRQKTAELPKLAGEIARLRMDSQELAELKAAKSREQNERALAERNQAAPGRNGPALSGRTEASNSDLELWNSRVNTLKQHLEKTPAARIPELQFATEQDWLNVARSPLDTDADVRKALSELRNAAISQFAAQLQPALSQFVRVNNGQFPADLSQLQSYLKSPVGYDLLDRYEIAPAETVPFVKMGGDRIITQKSPVDSELDSRWVIGPNGYGSAKGARVWSR